MGTIPPEDQTPQGYIQRAGHTANILTEATSETVYGRRDGSLWPLFLLILAALFVIVFPLAALIPLVLLALWVGGQR